MHHTIATRKQFPVSSNCHRLHSLQGNFSGWEEKPTKRWEAASWQRYKR